MDAGALDRRDLTHSDIAIFLEGRRVARLVKLKARRVLDSRGRPTIEVDAFASDGSIGRAIAPSGASTGRHEAFELRDVDSTRFGGRDVGRALANVEGEIARRLNGFELDDQYSIDRALIELDGSKNKSRLGGNSLIAVSLACARAGAESHHEELYIYLNKIWRSHAIAGVDAAPRLPVPIVNMISGGAHAGRNLDVQDVLAVPLGERSYSDSLERIVALYHELGVVLREQGEEGSLVGDEGGYGPKLSDDSVAIERVVAAIERIGLAPGVDFAIAVDVASTQFHDESTSTYLIRPRARDGSRGKPVKITSNQMIDMLESWVNRYPIAALEDPLAEDDREGWREITRRLGDRVHLIGDDLFVTDARRLREGVDEKVANAILIKPNQAGTLTETLETLALAKQSGYRTIVSARSGETEDSTIADLAVATASDHIKIGSVVRSERLAKYNRLLRIEEKLSEANFN
jgi:enolase